MRASAGPRDVSERLAAAITLVAGTSPVSMGLVYADRSLQAEASSQSGWRQRVSDVRESVLVGQKPVATVRSILQQRVCREMAALLPAQVEG